MKQEYKADDNIVLYFAFPKLNIVIPLRPGDVLFFNLHKEHCVSSCCSNTENVYCIALYVKSNLLGKNGNTLPLSQNMDALLHAYNELNEK